MREVPHEHAEPAVFAMLERVRAMCRAFYGQEKQRKALGDLAKRLGVQHQVVDLDNSNKWKATPEMLAKLLRGEALLANFFVAHGANFPSEGVLSEQDFSLAREVYGCLLPIQNASLLLEKDGFAGSSALPLLWAAARGLAEDSPVQVPQRGNVAALEDVEEGALSAPARAFRAKLREELAIDQRHLGQSRSALLVASALDPRWRGLPFASAAERAATRAALVEEAVGATSGAPPEPKRRRLRRIEEAPAALRVPGMDRLLSSLSDPQGGSRGAQLRGRRASGGSLGGCGRLAVRAGRATDGRPFGLLVEGGRGLPSPQIPRAVGPEVPGRPRWRRVH